MTVDEVSTEVGPAPVFDHTDPAFMADIHGKLAEIRETCPVVHSPLFGGFYAVLDHADVAMAANDYERFTPTGGSTIPKFELPTRSLPLESDPPEHGSMCRMQPATLPPRRATAGSSTATAIEDSIRSAWSTRRCGWTTRP
jgi:cytochrome P450